MNDFSFLLDDLPDMEPRSPRGYIPAVETAGPDIPEIDRAQRSMSNDEKVQIASNTAVVEACLDKTLAISDEDSRQAAAIFDSGRDVTTHELRTRPGLLIKLDAMMSEYDYEVVADATRIRKYITNRLIEESNGKSDTARLRALEKLGNLTEVGAFTERKEITINHETSESLTDTLREKLEALRGKVVQGEVIE